MAADSPIAFVSKLRGEAEAMHLTALGGAMPDEIVVPFRTLTASQRQAVEIAIVANPDPAEVASLPRLVWIQSMWAGVERLVADLGASAPPIVRLVDPEMARTMAEAVLAWVYYLQRDMPTYLRQQRSATWRQREYREPSTTTVGLLGLGALGAAAAERLVAAGFAVAAWSRSARTPPDGVRPFHGDDGLPGLLATSDIVVCLVPLTDRTRGMLSAQRFAAMKPGAALINFARGPIVVVDDLIAALDAGRLSHAVLDVFDEEPLPASSPLWRHPLATVLPHISAPTNMRTASAVAAANIRAYRGTGRIPEHVDTGRGY